MGAPLPHRFPDGSDAGEPARLTREMSSRKLLALDFIKRYFARWGQSPTLGEVAAALGVSTKRAHDLVHQLATQKMIEHVSGKTRGIRLLNPLEQLSEADVLARLTALGWTIGDGNRIMRGEFEVTFPPDEQLTEKGLPELPELDHDPLLIAGTGTSHDEQNEAERRRARATKDAGRTRGSQQSGMGPAAP